jgi:hypothetical protein
MCCRQLIKYNSLGTVQEHALLAPPLDSSGKHLALNVAAFNNQLVRAQRVVNACNALLNDRALIQIRSDEVSSGTDDLYTTLIRLVVRLCALERWQEGVVNVDNLARHFGAQTRRQDLHVSRQDDQFDVVLLDELQDLALLLGLGVLSDGEVVELDTMCLGHVGKFGVVGDNDGDLNLQLPRLDAEEEVVQAVTNLGYHDQNLGLGVYRADVIGHAHLLGEISYRLLQGSKLGRMTKVHAHEKHLGSWVGELLQVENGEILLCKQSGDSVHDACLVRAGQSEEVIGAGHFGGC